ncbi:MAG: hypothetical protein KDA24_14715 [Deltaproteobacteria bacterium]|nr:hypothetical protein [Deltaproteobacteria bacterium]
MRYLSSLVLALATLAFAAPAAAQGFISPVAMISPQQPSYVITASGDRHEGKIANYLIANGIRSLVLKTADGEKLKFKAADLKEVGNKPGALAKLSALSNEMDSKWDMFSADWKGAIDREWVYYRQALMPNGKAYSLLQQINPGFDTRIRVFNIDPEESDEYLVSRDGAPTVKVTKGNYKKLFPTLFAGCEAVINSDAAKKPKLKQFAAAVFVFDHECSEK